MALLIGLDRWRNTSFQLKVGNELGGRVQILATIITVWTTTVMTEDLELGGGGVYCGARLCERDIAAQQR
jgi:hypothetical protein